MTVTISKSDSRFIQVTECEFVGLFQKIPHAFREWLLQIRYKKSKDQFFLETQDIYIDSGKLLEELVCFEKKVAEDKCFNLSYAHGMTDIDLYIIKDKFVLKHSPNEEKYVYFNFSMEKFREFVKQVEYHLKEIKK